MATRDGDGGQIDLTGELALDVWLRTAPRQHRDRALASLESLRRQAVDLAAQVRAIDPRPRGATIELPDLSVIPPMIEYLVMVRVDVAALCMAREITQLARPELFL